MHEIYLVNKRKNRIKLTCIYISHKFNFMLLIIVMTTKNSDVTTVLSRSPRGRLIARMLLFSPSVGAIGLLKSPSRSGGQPFGAFSSCGDRCEQTLLARGALQELEERFESAFRGDFRRFQLVFGGSSMDFARI